MRKPSSPFTVVLLMSLIAAAPTAPPSAAQGPPTQLVELGATGLTIELPADWTPGGVSGETIVASFAAGDGLYPGFNARLESADNLEALHEYWIGLIGPDQVHVLEAHSVAGHDGLYTDVSWSSPLGALRAQRLLVAVDGQILVLTFMDRAGDVTEERAAAYRGYLDSVRPAH